MTVFTHDFILNKERKIQGDYPEPIVTTFKKEAVTGQPFLNER
jgi:hypothetical protein